LKLIAYKIRAAGGENARVGDQRARVLVAHLYRDVERKVNPRSYLT